MLPNVGPLEIVVVLIIALIVFGPKRLPELGNSLGKGIREFKESISGEHDDEKPEPRAEIQVPPQPQEPPPTQVAPPTQAGPGAETETPEPKQD